MPISHAPRFRIYSLVRDLPSDATWWDPVAIHLVDLVIHAPTPRELGKAGLYGGAVLRPGDNFWDAGGGWRPTLAEALAAWEAMNTAERVWLHIPDPKPSNLTLGQETVRAVFDTAASRARVRRWAYQAEGSEMTWRFPDGSTLLADLQGFHTFT